MQMLRFVPFYDAFPLQITEPRLTCKGFCKSYLLAGYGFMSLPYGITGETQEFFLQGEHCICACACKSCKA